MGGLDKDTPTPTEIKLHQKSHLLEVAFADGSRFFLIILRIATMFAPLRVFLPVSGGLAALGIAWYAYTWFTEGRFTNMVFIDVPGEHLRALDTHLREAGVRASIGYLPSVRLVTHLDVDDAAVDRAVEVFADFFS